MIPVAFWKDVHRSYRDLESASRTADQPSPVSPGQLGRDAQRTLG